MKIAHLKVAIVLAAVFTASLQCKTNQSTFAGENTLSGKFDIIRVDLQPSEEYKSVSINILVSSIAHHHPVNYGWYIF